METNNNRRDNSAYLGNGITPNYPGINLNGLVGDCDQSEAGHPANERYQKFFGKEA